MNGNKAELPENATREEKVEFYRDYIIHTLEKDGDVDKIRQLIKDQIQKTNWREDVKQMGIKVMTPEEVESLTPDIVAERIKEQAIKALPKNLTPNVTKHIKETITKKQILEEESKK